MAISEALMQLRFRRQQLAANQRLPNSNKKQPKWLHPVTVEIGYNNAIQEYIGYLSDIVDKVYISNIQSLIDQRNQLTPNGTRIDDWADDAERLAQQTKIGFDTVPTNITTTASGFANKTNLWNDKEWRKQLYSVFGTDIFQREPWLNETLNSWTKENVALITKMKDNYLSEIDSSVQRGVRSGSSIKNIKKDIIARTEVTENRGKLIARDQVSKLNGQLTELRQTNIGVKRYRWQDSDDIRVRTSHHANDQKIFSWDKPPANTGHPGEDYQCRCWAEPIFDEVKEELGMVKEAPEAVPSGTIVKSYGSKASAQSQKSRRFKNATLKFNDKTGKWELHIPSSVTPTPIPTPTPKPIPAPIEGQQYVVKSYGSKASAQSQKSRRFKDAILQFNDKTGKWELKIPVGGTPPSTPVVIPKPKPISVPKPEPTTTGEKVLPGFHSKNQGYVPTVIDKKEFAEQYKGEYLDQVAANRINEYTKNLRWRDWETSQVYDAKTGRRLSQISQHKPSEVALSPRHCALTKNNVDLHNHPTNGGSFSYADIGVTLSNNPKMSMACAKDYLYIMERNPAFKTWGDAAYAKLSYEEQLNFTMLSFRNDLKKMQDFWKTSGRMDLMMGRITRQEYHNYWTHKAMEQHSLKYNYKYTRIKYDEDWTKAKTDWELRKGRDPEPLNGKATYYN